MAEELAEPLLRIQMPSGKTLKLLTLNLFLRPPLVKNNVSDHKDARLSYFCEHFMENYDIICLQEVFSTMNTRRNTLIQLALSKGFQYSTYSPSPSFWKPQVIDGGLVILSRYPIQETDFFGFGNGAFPDIFSYKGILYAKIQVHTHSIHIFTLHTQATYPSESQEILDIYRQVRQEQIRSCVKFIANKIQFLNEPYFLLGDFNTDASSNEYDELIEFMKEIDLEDVLKNNLGHSPSTYGIINENGEPEETVLSHRNENSRDVAIDYIFASSRAGVYNQFTDSRVEPFYVSNEEFTRISDHYGVQTTIQI